MSREEDLALVRAAREDRAAFDALFDRYVDRVYRLARRRIGKGREAEALATRMLERIMGELHRFDRRSSLDAWVLARCQSALKEREAAALESPTGAPSPLA